MQRLMARPNSYRTRPHALALHWLAGALLVAMVGCERGPQVGKVSGVVTYDGQALPGMEISFDPVEGGRRSTAMTNSEGKYEANYTRDRKGALVGSHQVRVMWPAQSEKDLRYRVQYPIPDTYNANTTLSLDVERGANTFDLNIVPQ